MRGRHRGDRRGPGRQAGAVRRTREVVAADAILASNTSSLSPTALAAGLTSPSASSACTSSTRSRPCGWSRSSPASPPRPRSPTRPPSWPRLGQDRRAVRRHPRVHRQPDRPPLLRRGVARPRGARHRSETIDAVLTRAGGFRMGPFALMDLIGHDVNEAVTRSVWTAFGHDPRFAPSPRAAGPGEAGWLGRKTGRGVYPATAPPPGPGAAGRPRRRPSSAPLWAPRRRRSRRRCAAAGPARRRGAASASGTTPPSGCPTASSNCRPAPSWSSARGHGHRAVGRVRAPGHRRRPGPRPGHRHRDRRRACDGCPSRRSPRRSACSRPPASTYTSSTTPPASSSPAPSRCSSTSRSTPSPAASRASRTSTPPCGSASATRSARSPGPPVGAAHGAGHPRQPRELVPRRPLPPKPAAAPRRVASAPAAPARVRRPWHYLPARHATVGGGT